MYINTQYTNYITMSLQLKQCVYSMLIFNCHIELIITLVDLKTSLHFYNFFEV